MSDPLSSVPLRTFADRARQVILFEIIGLLLLAPLFALTSGEAILSSVCLLLILSCIAMFWNAIYCDLFDRIERRLARRPADLRPFCLRLAHACGFEGGLILFTLPVIMLWTGMGFWFALTADLGLALAYVGYAYVYNLAYDRIFPIR
ncbi:MAG: PACE efflux transporter [Betaproteobacteria bacterium]|nr:PACE efflux transporter [Betaproteobacteria bacterium]